jgi:Lipocalin-like domain
MDHKTTNKTKGRPTLTLTALAFLCLGIVLPVSDAVGQQKTLKERIAGTWILDSVYDQLQDGKKNNPWGPNVKGQAMFDGNRLSWRLMAADRSKTAPISPRIPGGLAIAYFGTYTVDDAAKTATFHVERCTFPQWDGANLVVNIAFPTENELNITATTPIPDPTMGPFTIHMNFKRAM